MKNVAVRDQRIGYWLGQRVIVERLSIRRLRHYGKVSLGDGLMQPEGQYSREIAALVLPGSGLTSSAGIARHVNRDQVAAAVLPVREVPPRSRTEGIERVGTFEPPAWLKCFPVKIEERMMLGGPVVKGTVS